MGRDFYSILGISKDASEEEIKKAYKKNAIKYHPDKVKFPPNASEAKKKEISAGAESKFKEVAQAYQILSDPEKKKVYDMYGEEGLSGSGPGCDGGDSRVFYADVDPMSIFNSMFSSGLFSDFGMGGGGGGHTISFGSGDMFGGFHSASGLPSSKMMFNTGTGGSHGANHHKKRMTNQPKLEKDSPINYNLEVTLEDILIGTIKKIKITSTDFETGRSNVNELSIEVKKGWKAGTKITYSSMGDKHPGRMPADVVFVVTDKPHKNFTRDKENNLIYTCSITLRQALLGCTISVPLLGESNTVQMNVPGVIFPQLVRVIPNKGLPTDKDGRNRSNLLVKFDIKFPTYISPNELQILEELRCLK